MITLVLAGEEGEGSWSVDGLIKILVFFLSSPKDLFEITSTQEIVDLLSKGYAILRDVTKFVMICTPFGLVLPGSGFFSFPWPYSFVSKILHGKDYT